MGLDRPIFYLHNKSMGFKFRYNSADLDHVTKTVSAIEYDASDMKVDSYVQFSAKQDLYRLKWIIDDALKRCPTFSIESDWLKEEEQKKIIKILSNDIQ